MITLKKSKDRVRLLNGGHESWRSFDADNPFDPAHDGFRSLECLQEASLAPGATFQFKAPHNLEVLTYVWQGSATIDDVVLATGEWRRSAVRTGMVVRGANGSPSDPARLFQCFITPDRGVVQSPAETRRFSLAERRGILRLLFSRTGRDSSLRLRQDAAVFSSVLDPGHHLVHELVSGRGAWLHVVKGRIQLVDQLLDTGDGAAVVDEPAVSLTAREPSEILLFDLL